MLHNLFWLAVKNDTLKNIGLGFLFEEPYAVFFKTSAVPTVTTLVGMKAEQALNKLIKETYYSL